jgi:hypothetical protein
MRTPDYDKLLEYGLDQRVAEKLDEIYKVPYRFMSIAREPGMQCWGSATFLYL